MARQDQHWSGFRAADDTKKRALADLLRTLKWTDDAIIALISMGVDTEEEVMRLDDERVLGIVKSLRSPGGAGAGVDISGLAAEYLVSLAWALRHQIRVSRPEDFGNITAAICRKLEKQKKKEDTWNKDSNNKIDEAEMPKVNFNDIPKTFEELDELLHRTRGPSGGFLSYVVRKTLIPPAEDDDPSTNYTTTDAEMIARAPIIDLDEWDEDAAVEDLEESGPFHESFQEDMVPVWYALYAMFHKNRVWIHAKATNADKNGRKCYWILHRQLLGKNHVDTMATKAETTLKNLTYEGESKNFTFVKYSDSHKMQHVVMDHLKPYGYLGMDERSKVRTLLQGIRGNSLDACVTQILASEELKDDFDSAVQVCVEYIRAKESVFAAKGGGGRKLSEMNSGGPRSRQGGGGAKKDVSEADVQKVLPAIRTKWFPGNKKAYIPSEVYKGFSGAEMQAVFRVRKEIESSDGGGGGGSSSGLKNELRSLKRTVAELTATAKKHKEAASDEDPEEEGEPKVRFGQDIKPKGNKGANTFLGRQN